MSHKDYEVEEGREIVGRTIVGGRPAAHKRTKIRVPIGIEKVLVRAAADGDFRKTLLDDRSAAIDTLGDELTPTERTVLSSIPDASLLQMIQSIDLNKHSRKRFMRGVVKAALIGSAATATVLSTECCSSGSMPDWPPDVPSASHQEVIPEDIASRGVRPDDLVEVEEVLKPADVIEAPDYLSPGGIMPDIDEAD